VDLSKVTQVVYSAATKQDSDPSLADDATSHPAISLTLPPSKTKSAPTTKQEKQKKPISITLMPQPPQDTSTTTHPLLTLYPTSKTTAIEWRDALRFLTGLAPGNETEEFTKRLADVGVRVKLLDIVAGGVEIPKTKPLIEGVSTSADVRGKVAITGEFWYDNMVD
jgi:hypothetical protein